MASWIWNHFDKLADGHAVCNECSATLSAKSSTWGLRRHLQIKHQIGGKINGSSGINCDLATSTLSEETNNATISRISEIPRFTSEVSRQTDTSDVKHDRTTRLTEVSTPLSTSAHQLTANNLTNGIARMIAIDMLPLSFCETRGFRDFMKILMPDYALPTKNIIKRSIEQLHTDTKATLAMKLHEYDFVVLSADVWNCQDFTSYLTITMHTLTPNWNTVSHALSTMEIHNWYTSDELSQQMLNIIDEWQLSDKIVATVHDNSLSITSACVKKTKIFGSSVPCFASILRTAVNKALRQSNVNELLKRANNVVKYIVNSATKELQIAQTENELSIRQLIQSCKTRWNSTFHMVQRLNEQSVAVISVLGNIRTSKIAQKLALSDDDWLGLEKLEELLEPLEAVTTVLDGTSDATLSLTRPLVHGLLKNFYASRETDSSLETSFKTVIRDEFLERFLEMTGDPDGVTLIATFLDPRYKDLSGETEDAIVDTESAIQKKLDEIGESSSGSVRNLNRRAALDFLFTGRKSTENSGRRTSEIFTYTREACVDTENDPRKWWKDNQLKYPKLSMLARRYLAIPAVSSRAERAFAWDGNISGVMQSHLAPESVDSLVFMHENADLA